MKLNIKELITFFDSRGNRGDATALIALLGEDLNASVYRHFRNNEVEILNCSVTCGANKGQRLDRWIVDKKDKKILQCEIKNWSASAIGGKQLDIDSSNDEIKKVVKYYWDRELNGNLSNKVEHPNRVTKVLLKMKAPKEYSDFKIEPLIVYWMPISSDEEEFNPSSCLVINTLNIPIKNEFIKLNIFSVSLYLRQLYNNGKGLKFIDLDMPNFKNRIDILNKLQN